MDYIDLINQHCPAEIQSGVAQLEAGARDAAEDEAFHYLTSMKLKLNCAQALTGFLAQSVTPNSSPGFKSRFQMIAGRYAKDFDAAGPAVFDPVRAEVGRALQVTLDDVQTSARGSILRLLAQYRINLLDEVRARADDRTLGQGFFADWQLNEYALCMGDETATDRLRRTRDGAGPQDLRQVYTSLQYFNICIPVPVLAELVRPSLKDNRVTSEVSGDGPPVSHFARELLGAL